MEYQRVAVGNHIETLFTCIYSHNAALNAILDRMNEAIETALCINMEIELTFIKSFKRRFVWCAKHAPVNPIPDATYTH